MIIGTSGRSALALGKSSSPLIPGMLMSDRITTNIAASPGDGGRGSEHAPRKLDLLVGLWRLNAATGKHVSFSSVKERLSRSFEGDLALPISAAGLEAIEAAPPSWAVTLALGENPREVALVNKTTELRNISELTPRIL